MPMPALDAAGRGLKIEKAADGLRTVIAQGITVADTPCVLLLGMPLPRNLQADGAEDAFTRALSQMQDDLRRDYVTGVYNSVYLNEAFRPRAERAALDGKPVGVVMVRVNEYWQLREQESDSAADCCLNMASGILQLVVGPDHTENCTTQSARAASRQARRPAASRAARAAGSIGTTPPPTSAAVTTS